MERASEPTKKEQTERILREYCEKLSLESISLFREDGLFRYSSDPSIEQPEDTESLFGTLDAIAYASVTGVPHSIIIYDCERCLICKPLYPQNWGEVEAWIIAHGKCRDVNWDDILNQLKTESNKKTKQDLSQSLETDLNKSIIERAYYLWKIIGLDFDFMEGTTVILSGAKGLVISTLGETPWGTTKPAWGDKYPDILVSLDELDMTLCSEIASEFNSEEEPEPETKPAEKNPIPIRLLYFTLLYGIFFMILNLQISMIILFIDVLILIGVVTRDFRPNIQKWTIIPIMMGGLTMTVPFYEMSGRATSGLPWPDYLILIPAGGYILTLGVLFWTLYGRKSKDDSSEK